jgi:hypothetical protein
MCLANGDGFILEERKLSKPKVTPEGAAARNISPGDKQYAYQKQSR